MAAAASEDMLTGAEERDVSGLPPEDNDLV
jgi:hypothetical protein